MRIPNNRSRSDIPPPLKEEAPAAAAERAEASHLQQAARVHFADEPLTYTSSNGNSFEDLHALYQMKAQSPQRRKRAAGLRSSTSTPPSSPLKSRTSPGKLQKRNAKRLRNVNRAQELRECITCGREADPKIKRRLTQPNKARDIILQLRKLQVSYEPALADPQGTDHIPPPPSPSRHHVPPRAICLRTAAPVCHDASLTLTPDSSAQLEGPSSFTLLGPDSENLHFVNLLSPSMQSALNLKMLQPESYVGSVFVSSTAGVASEAAKRSSRYLHNEQLALPHDRITVLASWWGYELALPPESIDFLEQAHSISANTFVLLQAMSTFGGLPELLPYIRYISAYLDFSFKIIQQQDRGYGVILASTWVMPLIIVPRPWDFAIIARRKRGDRQKRSNGDESYDSERQDQSMEADDEDIRITRPSVTPAAFVPLSFPQDPLPLPTMEEDSTTSEEMHSYAQSPSIPEEVQLGKQRFSSSTSSCPPALPPPATASPLIPEMFDNDAAAKDDMPVDFDDTDSDDSAESSWEFTIEIADSTPQDNRASLQRQKGLSLASPSTLKLQSAGVSE